MKITVVSRVPVIPHSGAAYEHRRILKPLRVADAQAIRQIADLVVEAGRQSLIFQGECEPAVLDLVIESPDRERAPKSMYGVTVANLSSCHRIYRAICERFEEVFTSEIDNLRHVLRSRVNEGPSRKTGGLIGGGDDIVPGCRLRPLYRSVFRPARQAKERHPDPQVPQTAVGGTLR